MIFPIRYGKLMRLAILSIILLNLPAGPGWAKQNNQSLTRDNYMEYSYAGRRTNEDFEIMRDKFPLEKEGF